MRSSLIIVLILSISFSCRKESSNTGFSLECNEVQHADSAGVAAKLTGSWTWKEQTCYWTGITTPADKNIRVTFNADGSYSVLTDAVILANGTWQLKPQDIHYWGVEMSPAGDYYYGYIFICGDLVMFADSYRDGCNNTFQRFN